VQSFFLAFFDLIFSFNEIISMACVLVLTLYWPLVVVTVVVVVNGVRFFCWLVGLLVGCLLFDCVGGGRGGGDGDSGGNVSLHSCWLCNWPLVWSTSMQIKN
jgi:hypothetical protein